MPFPDSQLLSADMIQRAVDLGTLELSGDPQTGNKIFDWAAYKTHLKTVGTNELPDNKCPDYGTMKQYADLTVPPPPIGKALRMDFSSETVAVADVTESLVTVAFWFRTNRASGTLEGRDIIRVGQPPFALELGVESGGPSSADLVIVRLNPSPPFFRVFALSGGPADLRDWIHCRLVISTSGWSVTLSNGMSASDSTPVTMVDGIAIFGQFDYDDIRIYHGTDASGEDFSSPSPGTGITHYWPVTSDDNVTPGGGGTVKDVVGGADFTLVPNQGSIVTGVILDPS